MIPEAMRAAFRWWAKHPWMVFWGIAPLFNVAVAPLLNLIHRSMSKNALPLFLIVLILSFFRGTFLLWQRSKIGTV